MNGKYKNTPNPRQQTAAAVNPNIWVKRILTQIFG
jgi:hypothetical protein